MQNTPDIDFHQLLAKHRRIAIIWGTDDVHEVRPDLSEDQAWEVLQRAEHKHDANNGIGWDTLEIIADDLYPESDSSEKENGDGN